MGDGSPQLTPIVTPFLGADRGDSSSATAPKASDLVIPGAGGAGRSAAADKLTTQATVGPGRQSAQGGAGAALTPSASAASLTPSIGSSGDSPTKLKHATEQGAGSTTKKTAAGADSTSSLSAAGAHGSEARGQTRLDSGAASELRVSIPKAGGLREEGPGAVQRAASNTTAALAGSSVPIQARTDSGPSVLQSSSPSKLLRAGMPQPSTPIVGAGLLAPGGIGAGTQRRQRHHFSDTASVGSSTWKNSMGLRRSAARRWGGPLPPLLRWCLTQLASDVQVVGESLAMALQEVFRAPVLRSAGWRVGRAVVGPDAQCQLSHRKLRSLDLSYYELRQLADWASSLACRTARQKAAFEQFRSWLQTNGAYDVIIDGANVAFCN